jgi:hypothetical protein
MAIVAPSSPVRVVPGEEAPNVVSNDDMPEVVDVPVADPRVLLAEWRTEPESLNIRVQIARECRISKREICELTGLDRATVRQILRNKKA